MQFFWLRVQFPLKISTGKFKGPLIENTIFGVNRFCDTGGTIVTFRPLLWDYMQVFGPHRLTSQSLAIQPQYTVPGVYS